MGKSYDIALIPGDGVGPEVIREGRKVLDLVSRAEGFRLNWIHFDLGGDRYLRNGETLPASILDQLKEMDAIYLGAIGHPGVEPGLLEREILLRIRFELDQYINFRPVELWPGVETPLKDKGPEDINFLVIRENTEGLYVGIGGVHGKGTPHEVALQESIQTRRGVERCVRYAFERCLERNRHRRLTLCGKRNVLTYTFDLWERVFDEIAREYPTIETDYVHVDALCMWMVKNPERFDVIVTDNMFGDIITDLGAIIQGGMGVAASGNINPEGVSMFEPIHGSSPRHAGKNTINPLAAIHAGALMLNELGERSAAGRVIEAIQDTVLTNLKGLGAGEMGLSTSEVGDLVARYAASDSSQCPADT